MIADSIASGIARSPTLHRLVQSIDATDGLVYVDEGDCQNSVNACLLSSVLIAGPHRVLRILVDLRKGRGCDLVGSIGHELQHALEVLSNPHIRSHAQFYAFFDRVGARNDNRFETKAARRMGLTVAKECSHRSSPSPVNHTLGTADAQSESLVRVRSSSRSIAAVIQEATTRSTRFRGLIETINLTDGLVYVEEGACGHSVAACLMLSVQVAGPHRLLRIVVDPHKYPQECDLMGAIGHELQHAIEVLSTISIRDFHAAHSFFEREGPTGMDQARFETPAAVRVGLQVLGEACGRHRQNRH